MADRDDPSEARPPDAGRPVDDPILEIRDATVTYEMNRGTSRVLDGVSIDVPRGVTMGIVGESGSGKSMFASALLDAVPKPGTLTGEIVYRPTPEESVSILELDDAERNRRRWADIAMVFQGAMSSWNPTMGIREHFTETLQAHAADRSAGMERARELLSDLYLDPERVLDSYPHELSGGMQQRALIALSLVLEPDVLVMDEPTAALDLLMQRSILDLLEDIKEKYGITLLFITHDLPLVAHLCDRLTVMYAFEFVETGTTREILHEAAHPYTRALLNATPNVDSPIAEMTSIDGASPDPVDVPEGCSYHPRCPLATERCLGSSPPTESVSDGHRVACYHWADAGDAIPFSWADGARGEG